MNVKIKLQTIINNSNKHCINVGGTIIFKDDKVLINFTNDDVKTKIVYLKNRLIVFRTGTLIDQKLEIIPFKETCGCMNGNAFTIVGNNVSFNRTKKGVVINISYCLKDIADENQNFDISINADYIN